MIGHQVVGKQGRTVHYNPRDRSRRFRSRLSCRDDARRSYALKLIAPVDDPAVRLSFEQEISKHGWLGARKPSWPFSTMGPALSGLRMSLLQSVSSVRRRLPEATCLYMLPKAGNPNHRRRFSAKILGGLGTLHTRIVHRESQA